FEEGENLGALLERRGTLPERDLLRILLPILGGLELVHNAGFIHRDIKPDNLHIRSDGSPVLLDFGSARHALGKSRTLTILVAPGYAPFEQYYSSSENQGPWTDIYGLGATCYRAIAGTQPLDAISRSKGILGSTREVLVPTRTVGSGRYSTQLLAAVDHALEFAEKDRPQTVAEWRRELQGEGRPASPAPAAPEWKIGTAPERLAPEKVAPPAMPPQSAPAAHAAAPAAQVAAARAGWSGARAPIAWAVAGSVAGAIAIAVFLRVETPYRDAEKQLVLSKQEVEAERKRLDEERKRDEDKRRQDELARKRLEEQQKQEDAKRRQDEQARLAEQQKRDEERRRIEEQERKQALAARGSKPATAPATKAVPQAGVATRPPPTVLPVAPEPSGPAPVVASVKPPEVPKPSPQAEQLARGEGALARGEYAGALEILRPLAQDGNTRAQIRLAEMYAMGFGVKQDSIQSYIWYSLAAREGNTAAAAGRDRMAARLQPAQIKQADKVVEGMRPR
ncbi:MAG: protein kinase domain-containing protein, partial [Burkholderiales bacterium]